ncbi:hypothetical protein [Escherichia coli]|uniref:Uncharacterized protein n=1 Tax=Escherichia coli TaxID=562 RepID=A0AAP7PBR6_ECOLX|nr:hypothetical protein [Escherichia coli]OKB74133.1 hypothetical protein BMT50_15830 [Escherichia coli]
MGDFERINGLGLNHLRNHNDYSACAILRFALRSVSYSAKVQICTLEQYQPVTAATAPAYATDTGPRSGVAPAVS